MRIAVVGGGIAGLSAAWAARRAGADVTVLFDRPGASALYSGALDVSSWEQDRLDAPIPAGVIALATAFDAWSLGTRSCRVATYEGVLRPARGADVALLDLAPLAGRAVAVADCPIDGWDGVAMARALGASRWATETRTRFAASRVVGAVDPSEARGSSFDVAALHDTEERVARLAGCLDTAERDADAWLLGPWLGTEPGSAERLRALLGKACGETTSPPGGPAGARFEAARDALFSNTGVHVRREHVTALDRRGGRFHPIGAVDGSLTAKDAGFDAAIVAIGGMVGGGVRLTQGGFELSIAASLSVGLDGRAVGSPSSLYGLDVGGKGVSVLERVGLLADGAAARGAPGIFVAGDCVEGRPRTALEATAAGIAAAERAFKR